MANSENVKNALADLQIASPCSVSWDSMNESKTQGVRLCGQCSKNVYDVSKMSSAEAELLLQRGAAAGSLPCMQLYKRHDGTILTDDCPAGLRRIRDSWRKLKTMAASVAALLVVAMPALGQNKNEPDWSRVPAGAPAPMDWNKVAMEKPTVKKLIDQIASLEKNANLSNDERIKVIKLRIEAAQEAEKNNVPYYAMGQLAEAHASADKLKEQSIKRTKISLLKDILKAQISNAKKLCASDATFKTQLQELESAK